MTTSPSPVIGIIGGMGPHAGLLLADRLLASTRAVTDQEHLPFVLVSYSDRIPDRSAWLDDRDAGDPAPAIVSAAVHLASLGVRFAGIACNTAHAGAIFDRVEAELTARAPDFELVHLVRETARSVSETAPGAHRIGVLATEATYRTGIYSTALAAAGFEPLVPCERTRREVVNRSIFDPVFGIKASSGRITDEVEALIDEAVTELADAGADAIVLGCTELSLWLANGHASRLPVVDSTTALARALVARAAPDRLMALVPSQRNRAETHSLR